MTTPRVSFEFFPPQSMKAAFRLWDTVQTLTPLDPTFVSVTYGAGGTTRELTHDAVEIIHKNYGLNVAAHLTCVNATRAETLEIADTYAKAGVTEIVALRGDPPKGEGHFTPHPEGFANACELIEALAETGNFHLRVGAYPDPHPEAADDNADVAWLKKKFEAGANSAITQFFFEPETFFRFRDRCEAAGIDAPILPGILPIENWDGIKKFAQRCGTKIPEWLDEGFTKAIAEGRQAEYSHDYTRDLCAKLVEGGIEDLHFYTLNKPALSARLCKDFGVTPKPRLVEVA